MKGNRYDLEERTLRFAVLVIRTCKTISINEFNRSSVHQVIRSATSVGANYREANGAASARDFRHKISLCRKESKETLYWLELLQKLESVHIQESIQECNELCKIFGRIIHTLDTKNQ